MQQRYYDPVVDLQMKRPANGGPLSYEQHESNAYVAAQSPSVSSDALPPAAVVFTVTVFSVAKRGT